MNKILTISLLSILASTSGCATAVAPAREAYILAKPHGWLEISVNDSSVSARPPREGEEKEHPLLCSILVKVNNEHFLADELYPTGENSPYSIKSGFRIAVPEGISKIELHYGGCKIVDNEVKSHSVEVTATIKEGWVTPISFDGVSLVVDIAEPNKTVTLESINSRLESIESSLGLGE